MPSPQRQQDVWIPQCVEIYLYISNNFVHSPATSGHTEGRLDGIVHSGQMLSTYRPFLHYLWNIENRLWFPPRGDTIWLDLYVIDWWRDRCERNKQPLSQTFVKYQTTNCNCLLCLTWGKMCVARTFSSGGMSAVHPYLPRVFQIL